MFEDLFDDRRYHNLNFWLDADKKALLFIALHFHFTNKGRTRDADTDILWAFSG